jgi:hypothetical protein
MPFEIKIIDNELHLTLPLKVRACTLCGVKTQWIHKPVNIEDALHAAPRSYLIETLIGQWRYLRGAGFREDECLLCSTCAEPLERVETEGRIAHDVAVQQLADMVRAKQAATCMNQQRLTVPVKLRVSCAGYSKLKNELYAFMYGMRGTCFEDAVRPGAVVNPCKATHHTNSNGSINPDLYIAPETH